MKSKQKHIVLVGAGIMSATLGILLKKIIPDIRISIYERLDRVGAESSDVGNNAGTGHSAFCELNYTPFENGKVDIKKALEIANSFEISKQLWAYLKENEYIDYTIPFINDIPHMSFVTGEENVEFLSKRYDAMSCVPIFRDMKFSSSRHEISDWIPLMMQGRNENQSLAVTKMDIGTDVNFGRISRGMVDYLCQCENVSVYLNHNINEFSKLKNGGWEIEVENLKNGDELEIEADTIFIGAGGGTLSLLEKADIEEINGYGGFPVSGQFLRCNNPDIVNQHNAKVYGKADLNTPPLSVPHLDTRFIDGERALFFGPYAGFTTKFLKNGSYFDFPLSIDSHNFLPILAVGIHNVDLTKYLLKQVTQSDEDRIEVLLKYYPNAEMNDWELTTAGHRVQIIKKDKDSGGVLKFGTEIVCTKDNTMAALLGASPGASTSVVVMLDVIQKLFTDEIQASEGQKRIREMIPSFGESLIDNEDLCQKTRQWTSAILQLN